MCVDTRKQARSRKCGRSMTSRTKLLRSTVEYDMLAHPSCQSLSAQPTQTSRQPAPPAPRRLSQESYERRSYAGSRCGTRGDAEVRQRPREAALCEEAEAVGAEETLTEMAKRRAWSVPQASPASYAPKRTIAPPLWAPPARRNTDPANASAGHVWCSFARRPWTKRSLVADVLECCLLPCDPYPLSRSPRGSVPRRRLLGDLDLR